MNAVILDFYGLPGCGKSTVSHLVAEKLRSINYVVEEPSYWLDHDMRPAVRKLKKLFAAAGYAVRRPSTAKVILSLVQQNGYHKAGRILSQSINVATKLSAIEKKYTRCDYIIFDEGIRQAAVSLAVSTSPDRVNQNMIELNGLLPRNIKCYSVYIWENIATSMERMDGRMKHDSRAEKEKDNNKRRSLLEKFEQTCNGFKAQDEIAVMLPNADVESKAEMIFNRINGK